jgi:uncharacterized protein (TIGR02217 family)
MESPRFPDCVAYGAIGGPEFSTTVTVVDSGYEQRNRNWLYPRGRWTVSQGVQTADDMAELIAFFRNVAGEAIGFRFKDYTDYADAGGGILGSGAGNGMAAYQLYKIYTLGANNQTRIIQKPVVGTVLIFRNSVVVTAGTGPGQIAFDTTTGIVTFVADAQSNITSWIGFAPLHFTTAAPLPGIVVGGKIYLDAVTGTVGAEINGAAYTVTAVSGSTYTLDYNVGGFGSAGTAYKYPQPASDALAWTGEFDVAARFDTDTMRVAIINKSGKTFLETWEQIPIVEIRV